MRKCFKCGSDRILNISGKHQIVSALIIKENNMKDMYLIVLA